MLGFKEPALLICVTLPAHLLGRGRRSLKISGGGTVTASWPPDAKKETGQDPRQRTHHIWRTLKGMGPGVEGCDGKGARWGTLIKASAAAEVGACRR